jgi:hypothetical protein
MQLQKKEEYKQDYKKFMDNIVESGYTEKAPAVDTTQTVWYIPHHGIYNTSNSKFRVVFDCSAKYAGQSLNDCLMNEGP